MVQLQMARVTLSHIHDNKYSTNTIAMHSQTVAHQYSDSGGVTASGAKVSTVQLTLTLPIFNLLQLMRNAKYRLCCCD